MQHDIMLRSALLTALAVACLLALMTVLAIAVHLYPDEILLWLMM